jgi:hypothetical protein
VLGQRYEPADRTRSVLGRTLSSAALVVVGGDHDTCRWRSRSRGLGDCAQVSGGHGATHGKAGRLVNGSASRPALADHERIARGAEGVIEPRSARSRQVSFLTVGGDELKRAR